jgi:hypothetical protein
MPEIPPDVPPAAPPPAAPAPTPVNRQEAVSLPGIFLLITGIIGILNGLASFAGGGIGRSLARFAQDQKMAEMLAKSGGGASGIISGVIVLAASALVIFGAIKMRQLQSWGLAMAASIVALLPCLGPCCCVGLPVGIWCLVILNKPEVKSAFQG